MAPGSPGPAGPRARRVARRTRPSASPILLRWALPGPGHRGDWRWRPGPAATPRRAGAARRRRRTRGRVRRRRPLDRRLQWPRETRPGHVWGRWAWLDLYTWFLLYHALFGGASV